MNNQYTSRVRKGLHLLTHPAGMWHCSAHTVLHFTGLDRSCSKQTLSTSSTSFESFYSKYSEMFLHPIHSFGYLCNTSLTHTRTHFKVALWATFTNCPKRKVIALWPVTRCLCELSVTGDNTLSTSP